ncbi:hypothetical protein PFISCL1PPCAC_608, partial [Pristionchus fissidentatus]
RTMTDWEVRAVLDERIMRGCGKEYLVAWKNTWTDAKSVSKSVDFLNNMSILGITNDSDQRKIKEAKFVIQNLSEKQKENQEQIWTYQDLREKAPELLLDFYEGQLTK